MFRLARVVPCGCMIAVAAAGSLQVARLEAAGPQASRAPATSVQTPSPTVSTISTGSTDPRALLDQYCVTCHNEKLATAGLLLDQSDIAHVGAGADTWEKVVRKLRSGAMPPPGRRRPDKPTLDAFVTWLETELDREAAAHPNPGRPADHRLNQFEYGNAVRDLLALEIDVHLIGERIAPAFWPLAIHLCFVLPTLVLWVRQIATRKRAFENPAPHRRRGRIVMGLLVCTVTTGIWLYSATYA